MKKKSQATPLDELDKPDDRSSRDLSMQIHQLIDSDNDTGDPDETARRLDDVMVEQQSTPPMDQSVITAVEPNSPPTKRRGGWPKGKPRGKRQRSVRNDSAIRDISTPRHRPARPIFTTRAALQRELDEATAMIATLTNHNVDLDENQIADLQYEIEGILLTIQAVASQRFGRHAVLSPEQSVALQRMWTRPCERALRYLTRRTDDGILPGWILPVVQVLLAGVGSVAVIWPNWTAHVDEQQATATTILAVDAHDTADAPHTDDIPAGIPLDAMASLGETGYFIRPRGA